MSRRLFHLSGAVKYVYLGAGGSARLERPARDVYFLEFDMAFVLFEEAPGWPNLLIVGPTGENLALLGTTCRRGSITELVDVDGEIIAHESTLDGEFMARLDLDSLDLDRIGEWHS